MRIPRGAASDRIAIELEGQRGIHGIDPTGNYATLCGLDGGDAGQETSNTLAKVSEQIDCPQCKAIWEQASRYKRSDFSA